jgi:hypothetical protein
MTRDDAPSAKSLTFDPEERAYVAEFDNTTGSPSTTVILMIAEITEQSETDLKPLYHVIDPDVLDRIVRDRPSGPDHNKRRIEFRYQDLTIRVLSNGVIKVYPPSTRGNQKGLEDSDT